MYFCKEGTAINKVKTFKDLNGNKRTLRIALRKALQHFEKLDNRD